MGVSVNKLERIFWACLDYVHVDNVSEDFFLISWIGYELYLLSWIGW